MLQVMDWLEQHGEPFLHRKIAIGHDLQSAQNLTNNHENFKKVAENTYRNARQLFTMAQQLKNSGLFDILFYVVYIIDFFCYWFA